MTFCANCGSEGITTELCEIRGSCKMHDTARLNRERDEAAQRGEKLNVDMTPEQRLEGLWAPRRK